MLLILFFQSIGSSWTPKTLHTFDDVVWHVSWSVSGNMLAVSGGDNKVRAHHMFSRILNFIFVISFQKIFGI